MEFEITRTSHGCSNNSQPCEDAHYDLDENEWYIELEWADLPKFIDKYGEIVLNKRYSGDGYRLEIYDDYRE